MPLTHLEKFKVRYTECDPYGHVNTANYLRYMQEAAFGASADAGYDFAKYDELGQYWLVRETDIEYLKPLRYQDEFEIKTWVQDFRRVRSRRMYEFRLSNSDELIARASTDWVYLDLKTNRPMTVPTEMIAAFFPEGAPLQAPPRDPFPAVPQPPASILKLQRRVAFSDIDMAAHVNNAVYLFYVEDAAAQVLAHFGWPIERIHAQGFAITVRRHRLEYLLPALLGDEIELSTWLSKINDSSATRHFVLKRIGDDQLLARVNTSMVWINLQAGQPGRIPEQFLIDFAPNVSAG